MASNNSNIFSQLIDQIKFRIWGDLFTAEEIIELLQQELNTKYIIFLDPLMEKRAERIQLIIKYLGSRGFPSSVSDSAEMSIIPFILYELNTCDINWKSRNANLKHLTVLLDADFAIQNKGKKRLRITNQEFQIYLENTARYIDYWKDKISIKSQAILFPK